MTPYRDRGRGTYVIDRRIATVGRIKVASGTLHLPTYRRLVEMIEGLRERGRYDILRAIQGGVLTPLQVYDAYRANRIELLPTAEMLIPLLAAYDAWVTVHECGEKHRQSLAESGVYLRRSATDKTTVAELPAVLERERERHKTAGTAVAFRLLRAACQAFARATLKRSSFLYQQVAAVELLKVTPKRPGRPQTVAGLSVLSDGLSDPVRAVAWSLATTGMGPGEYWGTWEHRPHAIHIEGTKREGRVRDVPDLGRCVRPPMKRWLFEDELHEQSGGAVSPYDLRRTFATWMEDAKIPRTRRRMYLGHGKRDVTDLYERHEVQAFLREDGAKLRKYLERGLPKRPKLLKSPAVPRSVTRHREAKRA